ncbi:MAG: DinB family protein [Planctomycetes bacterium]|nr:DinB family protein [Planctomycetota bacterium]
MAEKKPGSWVTDPEAYRKKMDDLLGQRAPLDVLSETPNRLAKIVNKTRADIMRTRPFPEKWTPNEIIGHMSDAEWVYGYRLRQILCEDEPAVYGMDHEAWVVGQEHNNREPSELLEMFSGLRLFNLGIWRRVKPADLAREGRHDERGRESLDTMLRMVASHDLSHLDQIRRYVDAIPHG